MARLGPRGLPPLRVAHSRKVMKGEDKWFATPDARWVPPGASPDDPDVHCHFSAFGLFDGHGGKDAAEHCVETMLPCLLAALDARGPVPPGVDPEDVFEDRLPAALEDAFEASDAAFLARDIHSGATATIVIVNGRCVTTAAVGDSLATVDVGAGAPPRGSPPNTDSTPRRPSGTASEPPGARFARRRSRMENPWARSGYGPADWR